MDFGSIIITLIILLFSVVLHELSHGVAAYKRGDNTAKLAGRLTLNPLPHLDPFGSILLPLFLFMVNSPIIFGSAKPVPVNFFNLRNPKKDMAYVSLAGPLTNFAIAIAFAIPIRFGLIVKGALGYDIMLEAVIMNLVLGIFNLIPIPPLDGSKIFASLFSDAMMYRILSMERFGFLIIVLFLYTGLVQAILVPLLRIVSSVLLGFGVV